MQSEKVNFELVMESRTPDFAGYPRLPLAMRALVRVIDAIPALRRSRTAVSVLAKVSTDVNTIGGR
jgi:hypothetical protein